MSSTQLMFDVTDTSNCVVDVRVTSIGSGNSLRGGATSYTHTTVEFTKFGET